MTPDNENPLTQKEVRERALFGPERLIEKTHWHMAAECLVICREMKETLNQIQRELANRK